MANNPTILNNLMNRDTYITCKCSLILGEILLRDMRKILHHASEEKLNSFVLQTVETIHRKVSVHLSMNNMSDFQLINLDGKHFEIHPQKNYFFYKFDGIENFSRGLENVCLVTGIIEEGKLFCFDVFRPEKEKIMWYQNEESIIYINNQMTWSDKHVSQKYKNKRKPLVVINTKNYGIYTKIKEFEEIEEITQCTIMGFNNFFLEFYFLLDESIDYLIKDKSLHPLEQILLNDLAEIEAIIITEFHDHLIIKKS